VSGIIPIAPTARTSAGRRIERFELFVEGRRLEQCKPGESIDLATLALSDGYHEVRLVAIEAGPIESQGRRIVPIVVNNHGRSTDLELKSSKIASPGSHVKLHARSAGAAAITVMHNDRVLGRTVGESGEFSIEAKQLGSGPVALQAIAEHPEPVSSRPVSLRIQ
jgi:hypothetical protein